MPKQDMCPICTKPFADDEVVIEYKKWGGNQPFTAHIDCALHLSRMEDRDHPPE